ncbi:DNA cytosine methyltransferase, partial [Spiroplasma melliferum]
MRGLSLFSNVGIAELYLKKLNIDIRVASELKEDRARFYKHIYPDTNVIIGDIKNKNIFEQIIAKSKEEKIDFILATPPCQGMSNAGKGDWKDQRNLLVKYVIDAMLVLKPKYVLLENVPNFLNTKIYIDGENQKITNYITNKLHAKYFFDQNVVNAADYGVPQIRKRAIILFSRKDVKKVGIPLIKEKKWVTVRDAIGSLPSLEPIIRKENNNKPNDYSNFYKWHFSPTHCMRHIEIMKHTPTGKSAFENIDKYMPRKENGDLIKGFLTTYKRIEWDLPAPTITMAN